MLKRPWTINICRVLALSILTGSVGSDRDQRPHEAALTAAQLFHKFDRRSGAIAGTGRRRGHRRPFGPMNGSDMLGDLGRDAGRDALEDDRERAGVLCSSSALDAMYMTAVQLMTGRGGGRLRIRPWLPLRAALALSAQEPQAERYRYRHRSE